MWLFLGLITKIVSFCSSLKIVMLIVWRKEYFFSIENLGPFELDKDAKIDSLTLFLLILGIVHKWCRTELFNLYHHRHQIQIKNCQLSAICLSDHNSQEWDLFCMNCWIARNAKTLFEDFFFLNSVAVTQLRNLVLYAKLPSYTSQPIINVNPSTIVTSFMHDCFIFAFPIKPQFNSIEKKNTNCCYLSQ